jgi:hypothetical protein
MPNRHRAVHMASLLGNPAKTSAVWEIFPNSSRGRPLCPVQSNWPVQMERNAGQVPDLSCVRKAASIYTLLEMFT